MVARSQVLSIQPVVMLRCCPVLKLPGICLEVTAVMLPPQAAAPAIECIHGEVAGNIHTLGDCIAANAERQFSQKMFTMLNSVVRIGISWVVRCLPWVLCWQLCWQCVSS